VTADDELPRRPARTTAARDRLAAAKDLLRDASDVGKVACDEARAAKSVERPSN
jgi:hypothetical protein